MIDNDSYSKYASDKKLSRKEINILSRFEEWSREEIRDIKDNNLQTWNNIKKYFNNNENTNAIAFVINNILLPKAQQQHPDNNKEYFNVKKLENNISDTLKYLGLKDDSVASNHEMLEVFIETFNNSSSYNRELLKDYFADIVYHNIGNIV